MRPVFSVYTQEDEAPTARYVVEFLRRLLLTQWVELPEPHNQINSFGSYLLVRVAYAERIPGSLRGLSPSWEPRATESTQSNEWMVR